MIVTLLCFLPYHTGLLAARACQAKSPFEVLSSFLQDHLPPKFQKTSMEINTHSVTTVRETVKVQVCWIEFCAEYFRYVCRMR